MVGPYQTTVMVCLHNLLDDQKRWVLIRNLYWYVCIIFWMTRNGGSRSRNYQSMYGHLPDDKRLINLNDSSGGIILLDNRRVGSIRIDWEGTFRYEGL